MPIKSFKIYNKSFQFPFNNKKDTAKDTKLKTRTNSNGTYKGVVVFIRSLKLAKMFDNNNFSKNNTPNTTNT
jgi:hypothetical protein